MLFRERESVYYEVKHKGRVIPVQAVEALRVARD
jgi:hypothetical protein